VQSGESALVQRGFALIALLALAALISAFLIASALNLTSAGNSNEREDRSMSALRKAKAALIAYAANEQWQLYKISGTYFQPGALPCPDQDDDGDADCIGSNLASMIGRLPFKTLGIDDLRDASGERIWYVLSHDFRKLQCSIPPAAPIAGCTTINSDTLGQLTVTGMAPVTQVVAIVFSPGAALDLRAVGGPLQDRVAGHNDSTNYLENVNLGDNIHFTFTSTGLPTSTSNDRLLVITQADLMAAVEPVVAANIERDVKLLLQDYYNKWGSYPFAAPFVAPPAGQSAYQGVSNQTMGLLPLTNDPAWLTWASATVTDIVGSGTGIYDGTTNTISPNPTTCTIASSQATCTINYAGTTNNDRPDIKLEVLLANASIAFADTPSMVAPDDSNIVMVDRTGTPLSTTAYGQWSALGSPPRPPTLSFAARADGKGAVTYTGRLQNAQQTSNRVTITVPLPAPSYLPRLTNTNPNPNITWFTLNQWYRQTYYAVSQNYLPGASPTPPCTAGTTCLTVNNLPTPNNNKQAILVFAGRALDGQNRIAFPGTLANYLEGQNATPADLIFEHRAGTVTTINDRVVVVSP
jgi:type II secretory pathway pseudopilin PulG